MSAPCKFELSILNHDETALIRPRITPKLVMRIAPRLKT